MAKRLSAQQQLKRAHELAAAMAELDKVNVRQILAEHTTVPMRDIIARIPGKTIEQKAQAAGVVRATVHNWRNGRRPILEHAERLVALTGYSLRQITNE